MCISHILAYIHTDLYIHIVIFIQHIFTQIHASLSLFHIEGLFGIAYLNLSNVISLSLFKKTYENNL